MELLQNSDYYHMPILLTFVLADTIIIMFEAYGRAYERVGTIPYRGIEEP
jgi:hypothetical protein